MTPDLFVKINPFYIRWITKLAVLGMFFYLLYLIWKAVARGNYNVVLIILAIYVLAEISHYIRKTREKVMLKRATIKNEVKKNVRNLVNPVKSKNKTLLKTSKPKNQSLLKKKNDKKSTELGKKLNKGLLKPEKAKNKRLLKVSKSKNDDLLESV